MKPITRIWRRGTALACALVLALSLLPTAGAAYEIAEIVGGDPNCRHEFIKLWANAVTEKSSCTETTCSYWPCQICGARYICGIHYPQGHEFVNGVCRYCGISQNGEATENPGTADPGTANPGTTDPGTANPGTANPGTANPGTSEDPCAQSGHDWQYSKVEPTCTSEGYSRRVCAVCGEEEIYARKGKVSHSWTTRTEEPTASREGRTYRVCTVCGLEETLSTSPVRSSGEQAAYEAMTALKSRYPNGTHWTNDNYYAWHGGIYSGGYGCAGFAFMLSDAAFGELPARKVQPVSFTDVRVGDILRERGDTHSVIVLEVRADSVVIAEGNMNSSVLWGRTLKKSEVESASYLMTRWPAEGAQEAGPAESATPPAESTVPPAQTPRPGTEAGNPFTDVPANAYYHDAVLWALDKGVTTGVTETRFQPNAACTRGQVVTFLWRAKGCPEPKTSRNPFRDVSSSSPFYKAILWAAENGVTTGTTDTTFSPSATCTSGHVVTFLWRANGEPAAADSSALAAANPGRFFTDAVAWADAGGLLSGTGRSFNPAAQSPRSDIVTYLYRDLAQ